eukprot:6202355-Pleurochrysis_carterae.AAC.1
MYSNTRRMNFQVRACNCKMGYIGLNQEQVVAKPCNLAKMLQVGVREETCRISVECGFRKRSYVDLWS